MVAFNRFNRFRKGKAKANKKAKVVRVPRMSFAQRVNKIIASNVENKYTNTEQNTLTVLDISMNQDALGARTYQYKHLVWTPGSTTNIWRISQGIEVNQRIGNNIKIKKWIIKGIVQPDPSFVGVASLNNSPTTHFGNSTTGYIDIYFGRALNNLAPPPVELTNFYQNGNVDITPISLNIENLYRVNKDLYKVYWHKRFKMSTGNVGTTTTSLNFPQSNDFQMTRSFGFDVTKYILKNKQLKYDEVSSFPQQGDLNNLTLWAIWHPAVGNPVLPIPVASPGVMEQRSFYQINLVSFGEFEDA